MIRPARNIDLDPIAASLPLLVAMMNEAGNDQWGPHYPLQADFAQDLAEGALFVDDEDGAIRGFMALNLVEPSEYGPLPWKVPRPALVIHRLAVAPEFRRLGVAEGLLAFAEARAGALGLAGLRSDTSEANPAMNALFAKRAWKFVGKLRFPDAKVGFRGWEKPVPDEVSRVQVDGDRPPG